MYGLSEFGTTAFSSIKGFYLNAFLLEVAGIPAGTAGILLLLAKIVDAVLDPIIGYASDRTVTRCGRRKIWVAIAMLPLCVSYVALWIVPDFDALNKSAYYGGMIIIYSALLSCVALPIAALAPELTENYDERTSLMVFKVAVFSIAIISGTFIHSLLVEAFPGAEVVPPALNSTSNVTNPYCPPLGVNGTQIVERSVNYQLGYLVSGFLWAIVALIPLVLLLIFVPERPSKKLKPHIRRDGSVRRKNMSVVEGFMTMVRNRAFVCVMLVYLSSQLAIQFIQNNLFLWTKYVLLREEWFSYLLLVLLGTSFLVLPFWERVARRIGKPKVYAIGAFIVMIMMNYAFVMEWMPQLAKDVTIWMTAAVTGVGISALFLIPVSMFPDVIERDELETGVRREGIYYSFFVFFQKVALAGALAISNFILAGAGYVSPETAGCSTPVQSDKVKLILGVMLGPIPCGIVLLSLIALYFYPITKENHLHTLKLLDEQRKAKALVTTDNEATVRSRGNTRDAEVDGDFQ